jgi:hypothetical protein
MAVGILFAVIGLNTWLVSVAPKGTPLALAAWIALPVLTIGGIFWVQRFVKNLKERLVFPRTGYIVYEAKPNRFRWLVIGFALALAVSILVLPYEWLTKGSITGGALLCVILASIGAQVDLKRLIAIGALGLVLGVIFAFLPLSDNAGLAATISFTGLILTLVGGMALRSYLSANPLPDSNAGVGNG